jgi:hypothetical protein
MFRSTQTLHSYLTTESKEMWVKLECIRRIEIRRRERKCVCALRSVKEQRRNFVGRRELLARIEAPVAHHLVENKFPWHPTHVLSSAGALVLLISLPAKQP